MKYTMMTTRPGIAFSYLVSGSTGTAGAANIVKDQLGEIVPQPVHIYFGFELSEIALIVGIAGTCLTVFFQYMNYRNNKKK